MEAWRSHDKISQYFLMILGILLLSLLIYYLWSVKPMHDMRSVATGIFLPQMGSHCYSLPEKINYWKALMAMQKTKLDQEFRSLDLSETVKSVKIPVYFFSGEYDYTCPYPLVKKFYEALDAKEKKFYSFENSAHSPLWEENEKMIEILVNEILPKE